MLWYINSPQSPRCATTCHSTYRPPEDIEAGDAGYSLEGLLNENGNGGLRRMHIKIPDTIALQAYGTGTAPLVFALLYATVPKSIKENCSTPLLADCILQRVI